jgi:hypothetical protein
MIIPNIWKNKSHVPNHQPAMINHQKSGIPLGVDRSWSHRWCRSPRTTVPLLWSVDGVTHALLPPNWRHNISIFRKPEMKRTSSTLHSVQDLQDVYHLESGRLKKGGMIFIAWTFMYRLILGGFTLSNINIDFWKIHQLCSMIFPSIHLNSFGDVPASHIWWHRRVYLSHEKYPYPIPLY